MVKLKYFFFNGRYRKGSNRENVYNLFCDRFGERIHPMEIIIRCNVINYYDTIKRCNEMGANIEKEIVDDDIYYVMR